MPVLLGRPVTKTSHHNVGPLQHFDDGARRQVCVLVVAGLGPHSRNEGVQRLPDHLIVVGVRVLAPQPKVQIVRVTRPKRIDGDLPTRQAHGKGGHQVPSLANRLRFHGVVAPPVVALLEQRITLGVEGDTTFVLAFANRSSPGFPFRPPSKAHALPSSQGTLDRRAHRECNEDPRRQLRAHIIPRHRATLVSSVPFLQGFHGRRRRRQQGQEEVKSRILAPGASKVPGQCPPCPECPEDQKRKSLEMSDLGDHQDETSCCPAQGAEQRGAQGRLTGWCSRRPMDRSRGGTRSTRART